MMLQNIFRPVIDYIASGGLVMLPIILCSCVLWVLGIERILFFIRAGHSDLDIAETLHMIRNHDSGANLPGLRRDLVSFMVENSSNCKEANQNLLHQYRLKTEPVLMQHISLIATLAAIAPLLGLLGTVGGMIHTFDVITAFGTGNAKAMAGGISQSLVTTQSGLTVAIPGMFLGVFLTRWARRLRDNLDETISILQRSMA